MPALCQALRNNRAVLRVGQNNQEGLHQGVLVKRFPFAAHALAPLPIKNKERVRRGAGAHILI
eukprot:3535171-Heterocapsa_arctica.AAC.1